MSRCVSLLAICMYLATCDAYAVEPPPAQRFTAIVGSRVLPMTGERVIEDATVLVADNVIRAVGASDSIEVPRGARVIAAQGMFLLPGLGEMHAHVPAGPSSCSAT
jgi:imidazolonepropionase-like amidohydrolase